MDRRLLDYTPVLETFGSSEFEREAARDVVAEAAPLGATDEFSLAADLLEVRSEAGLQRFLFKLIGHTGSDAGRLVRSPTGRALVDLLQQAARLVLLPIRSTRTVPGRRAVAGRQPPRRIVETGEMFGLELEGLSPEDKEFALARQFVRLASEAARTARQLTGEPRAAAEAALQRAARRHAPGLLARMRPPADRTGRWIRRAGQIIVLGC